MPAATRLQRSPAPPWDFAVAPRCPVLLRWLMSGTLVATSVAVGVAEPADDVLLHSLRPKYERVHGDIETVWQRPRGEPKGIVFIAHGCQHQGTDIFSDAGRDGWVFQACKSSNFGRCLGLPEEVHLRQTARERGYIVMAVSGGYGVKSCWDMSKDVARVSTAIQHVKSIEKLADSADVFAIGASSGGAFVGLLASPVESGGFPNLRCIVPQIMDVRGAANRGVPALFVHMPKDQRTAVRVRADIDSLHSQGIRAEEIQVTAVPVTEAFLAPCLEPDLTKNAVEILHRDGIIDEGGYLRDDGRARTWVAAFAEASIGRRGPRDAFMPDESCIAELMNVAWAKHEFTSQYAVQMFDFCEGQPLAGDLYAALKQRSAEL